MHIYEKILLKTGTIHLRTMFILLAFVEKNTLKMVLGHDKSEFRNTRKMSEQKWDHNHHLFEMKPSK